MVCYLNALLRQKVALGEIKRYKQNMALVFRNKKEQIKVFNGRRPLVTFFSLYVFFIQAGERVKK